MPDPRRQAPRSKPSGGRTGQAGCSTSTLLPAGRTGSRLSSSAAAATRSAHHPVNLFPPPQCFAAPAHQPSHHPRLCPPPNRHHSTHSRTTLRLSHHSPTLAPISPLSPTTLTLPPTAVAAASAPLSQGPFELYRLQESGQFSSFDCYKCVRNAHSPSTLRLVCRSPCHDAATRHSRQHGRAAAAVRVRTGLSRTCSSCLTRRTSTMSTSTPRRRPYTISQTPPRARRRPI